MKNERIRLRNVEVGQLRFEDRRRPTAASSCQGGQIDRDIVAERQPGGEQIRRRERERFEHAVRRSGAATWNRYRSRECTPVRPPAGERKDSGGGVEFNSDGIECLTDGGRECHRWP